MPRIYQLISLMLVFQLYACSSMTAGQRPVAGLQPSELELAEQRAQRLSKLEQQPQKTPSEQDEIKKLQDQLWRFEQVVIRTAVRLEQKDEWSGAKRVIKQALKKVPSSDVLAAAKRQLKKRRAMSVEIARAELAIHEGERLLKDADTYQRLAQLKSRSLFMRLELNRYQGQCEKTAADLQRYAGIALERKDYYLARRGFSIAQRLDGNEEIKRGLALANDQIRQINRQLASTRTNIKKPNRAALVAEFQQALQDGDLDDAKRHLRTLQTRFPNYEPLLGYQSQLNAKLRLKVDTAIENGRILYSKGKINEALALWRQAEKLDKHNKDLQDSINRAEKVLQNLRNLSASQ